MSLNSLRYKYGRNYLNSECNHSKNVKNPSRCPLAPVYIKEVQDFVKKEIDRSQKDTKKKEIPLLKKRHASKEHKNIYPIVNHDFDYKTAAMKEFNPYKLGITNKPTFYNLSQAPLKLLKYYDGLVSKPFPNKNSVAGVSDVIHDDKQRLGIKFAYKMMNKDLPYPTFKNDYPECKYPTTGKHASSYFIKSGQCKTIYDNKKDCEVRKFKWIPNKLSKKLKSKDKSKNQNIIKGTCYKPRFIYINNESKGILNKHGLIPSSLNDLLNLTPEKLMEVLSGNTIDGTGIIPCTEYFDNYSDKSFKKKTQNKTILLVISIILLFLFYLYFK